MDTYYCVVLALFFRIYAIAFPLVQSQGLPWAMDKNSHLFDYQTTTSLQDPSSMKDPAVGFKLECKVEITPFWKSSDAILLKLSFSNPKLSSLSKSGIKRDLNFLSKYPAFGLWRTGKITKLFGANRDSKFSLNLKRGVISVIQGTDQKEAREHDVRGLCSNRYNKIGDKLFKTTTDDCITDDQSKEYKNVNELFDSSSQRQYSANFSFTSNEELEEVSASETYESSSNLVSSISNKILIHQSLKRISKKSLQNEIKTTSLDEVIKSLKSDLDIKEISIEAEFDQVEKDKKNLSNFLEKEKKNFLKMATEEAAFTFLRLVQLIRMSSEDDIKRIIADENHSDIKYVLVDACSAAQTKESLNAILEIIDINDQVLTERFLLAAAFSTHPQENLLKILLKFLKSEIKDEKTKESVAGALGAVLHTYSYDLNKDDGLIKDILDLFKNNLKACDDVSCALINIRALGNAGQLSSVPVLIDIAKSHQSHDVNEAALKALRKMKKLNSENVKILKGIYHQKKKGYDTAVRSKALRLILKNNISQDDIFEIIESLNEPYNTELATFVKAYLFDKSTDDKILSNMVQNALKTSKINTYNGLATKGKSLSFHNFLARTKSFDSIYDMYVENTRTGVMKRSGMDVDVNGHSIYSFGLFSAGVESLLGEKSDDDSVVTAGLSLDMLGVGFRPITFFTGRSGLMSAVWNAPSTMTSALQANMLLQDKRKYLKLGNGVTVIYSLIGSISMDLSGLISISLWNKNAHTEIKNTGAYSSLSSLRILSPFISDIEHHLKGTGVINFDSDVDFYDKLKSCLQMSRPTVDVKHNTLKSERMKGFKGYTHIRKRTFHSYGVSYPLPQKNNDMCREMMKTKN